VIDRANFITTLAPPYEYRIDIKTLFRAKLSVFGLYNEGHIMEGKIIGYGGPSPILKITPTLRPERPYVYARMEEWVDWLEMVV
jgi:hypothetical protein